MMQKFSFIIVAGGSASRMGGVKKQFELLNNNPVWKCSALTAAKLDNIQEIVLVLPGDESEKNINLDWDNNLKSLKIAYGGSSRALSVLNGLEAANYDYVMIHDAARPFASENLLLELMRSTSEKFGAIPVMPVSDALKKIQDEKISCIERDNLYITQTPQSFYKQNLIEVIKKYPNAKDEAEAWLKDNLELKYITGEKLNFKITWPDDMKIAKALVENKNKNKNIIRTGIGWDIHRLVPERNLILGGVLINSSRLGLLGHSDADLLTHAIMDAILGAAGLPDIGNLFPASDMKYKNISSLELLKHVIELVFNDGWDIEWVDAIIQAQVPKLNNYISSIKLNLENIIGNGKLNIKAKSAENIDAAGAGLSMTCQAVATLIKNYEKGNINIK